LPFLLFGHFPLIYNLAQDIAAAASANPKKQALSASLVVVGSCWFIGV